MYRIDKILKHDLFIANMNKNQAAEAGRCFCRHDMVHFLDVARIGMILNLEEGQNLDKDLIYAASLLHDIGKHKQYDEGIPHEKASAEIAPVILQDCGFNEEETCVIIKAILAHRDSASAESNGLTGILYRADKASRACFCCKAEKECDWKNGRKNLVIKY